MDESVRLERERCVAIVEFTMLEAPAEAQATLMRVRNMIANGLAPQTFAEQSAEALEEMRDKRR